MFSKNKSLSIREIRAEKRAENGRGVLEGCLKLTLTKVQVVGTEKGACNRYDIPIDNRYEEAV